MAQSIHRLFGRGRGIGGYRSGTAIITIAIFDFMWGWHDYINPLAFLQDPDKFTLSVGLRLDFSQHGAEWVC